MIQITFEGINKSNKIEFTRQKVEVKIIGHAEFSKNGSDIVCAAVSTLTQTGWRSLQKIAELELKVKQQKGNLTYSFKQKQASKQKQEIALIILETIITGLEEIANNYPHNVEIVYL